MYKLAITSTYCLKRHGVAAVKSDDNLLIVNSIRFYTFKCTSMHHSMNFFHIKQRFVVGPEHKRIK